MLLVSVVLPVSVESAMECQMRVNDVFCAVSLSDTMRSAICVLLEKNASVIFLMLMPWGCHLLAAKSSSAEQTSLVRILVGTWEWTHMMLRCMELVS